MKPSAWLVALLAAGCTILDGRPRVEVEAATLPFAGPSFELTVRVRGESRTAQVLVDGRVRGEVQTNQLQRVNLSEVAEGTHRLRARLVDAPYPAESSEIEIRVDHRLPAMEASPAPGPFLGTSPPTITLRFSDEGSGLAEVSVAPQCRGCATVEEPSPGTFVVQLLGTLDEVAGLPTALSLALEVRARDRAGNVLQLRPSYEAAPLGLALEFFPPPPLGGIATTTGPVVGGVELPSVVELHAAGRRLGAGTVQGPIWSVTWDTRQLPDGRSAVSLRSPNRRPSDARDFVIDNTPPVLLGCQPSPDPVAHSVHAPVGFRSSEQVFPLVAGPEADAGGEPVRVAWGPGGAAGVCLVFANDVPVPSTLELRFPAGTMVDVAGNPAEAFSCGVELAPWVAPAGRGPVATGVDEFAGSVVASGDCAAPRLGPQAFVGDAPGSSTAGTVFTAAEGRLNVEPGAIASELQVRGERTAWLERAPGGPGHVYVREAAGFPTAGPLNADPARDAADPALDGFAVAWSEETAAGGRTIRTRLSAVVTAGEGPLTEDPAAVARMPAVSWPLVAWVEQSGGGPAQVRVKTGEGLTWAPMGSPSLNADPGRPAAEPAVAFVDFDSSTGQNLWALAWTEGGRLFLREWDGFAWGPPRDLGADPVLPARMPRFSRGFARGDVRLLFVQATAGGDEIRMRRWAGGSWTLAPGAAAAEPPGQVRRLWVGDQSPLPLAWTDGARRAHLRMYNE